MAPLSPWNLGFDPAVQHITRLPAAGFSSFYDKKKTGDNEVEDLFLFINIIHSFILRQALIYYRPGSKVAEEVLEHLTLSCYLLSDWDYMTTIPDSRDASEHDHHTWFTWCQWTWPPYPIHLMPVMEARASCKTGKHFTSWTVSPGLVLEDSKAQKLWTAICYLSSGRMKLEQLIEDMCLFSFILFPLGEMAWGEVHF